MKRGRNFRSCSIHVLLGIIAMMGFIRWAWISEDASNTECRLTQNGAWISVDWVSKPIKESAVRELAENAAKRKIRYLFAYTTYLKPDSSFNPTFDYAPEFVSQFRRFNQDGLVFAWVGVPLKNDRSIGIQGWVDLTDQFTRQKIVTLIVELMARADFDGVHLNVETVRNNDPAFLQVLDEIRAAIGSKRKISIAASHWMPGALNALSFLRDFRWTDGYYRQVAKRVDQIVTMTYDSYSPTSPIYRLWVREQVRGINASLTDSGVELLIGISVSKEETLSHPPQVENLRNGLTGLCAGISNQPGVDGVAIYADWDFSSPTIESGTGGSGELQWIIKIYKPASRAFRVCRLRIIPRHLSRWNDCRGRLAQIFGSNATIPSVRQWVATKRANSNS